MLGEVIAGLLNLFPSVIVTLGIVDVGLHQSDIKPSLSATRFTFELGGVDLVFKASAIGVLDHKALLVGGSHLIEEKRDQLNFNVAEFSFLDDLTVFTKWVHCTSL